MERLALIKQVLNLSTIVQHKFILLFKITLVWFIIYYDDYTTIRHQERYSLEDMTFQMTGVNYWYFHPIFSASHNKRSGTWREKSRTRPGRFNYYQDYYDYQSAVHLPYAVIYFILTTRLLLVNFQLRQHWTRNYWFKI